MLFVKEVSYAYSERFQIQNMNIHIKAGEIVSLIGPNGSGKSTLLRLIARLLDPGMGEIILDGKNIHSMKSADVAKKLAMLPQMQDHQLDLTVKELVEFGRQPHKSWNSRLGKEDEEIVTWALSVTKLEGYEYRLLQSLSGGERLRAWIAMTLAQRTNVLLLDEPTTFLDIVHQLEVMELVKRLNEEFGMTIVMVLHDINQAAQYSDRLLVLKQGEIQYDGMPECVLCHQMFQQVFGIEVDIFQGREKPFFTPKRICKKGEERCKQKNVLPMN
ncbi:ABC transporter ATP-binding protein [Bacillus sp. Xin]|nr:MULTISPECIES: ABC transporter ATP-binding protein [unclassified Bacillus (in: firmicutes)]MBC6974568.1 ABC transporter ATP-binding protein [Bacillus sp. Xin]NSW34646.1 ABC transporter ATP-binding protein [Bacillus sp. Xin1]